MADTIPGKQDFVRRALLAEPDADLDAINRAWRKSGRDGSIGRTTFGKVRAGGARGDGPGGPSAGGRGRPGPAPGPTPPPAGPRPEERAPGSTPGPDPEGRRRTLGEIERGLDRLLFRAMALGDIVDVEEALRGVRRLVVLAGLPCRPKVAVVGASPDRAKFGNKAVRAFARAGFEVYPIHPRAERVEGLRAYPSLDDLPPGPLDRVSIYVPAAAALGVLDQAARRRIGQVWLNPGADAPEVVERARVLGLEVVRACSILAVGEHPDRL